MAIINKKCENCGHDLIGVNHQTKYCETCRKNSIKNSSKKYSSKIQKEITLETKQTLSSNFINVIAEPYHLTPLGFNKVSSISYQTYQNFHKLQWIEIVRMYNKFDILLEYVVDEYKYYIKSTGNQDLKNFSKHHPYIGGQLLKTIGFDNIRCLANIKKKRNNKEICIEEFNKLLNIFGRVPLYFEFMENSNISLKSFKKQLNIKESKNIYDLIVKECVDKSTYEQYLIDKSEHKAKVGRENHQGYKYSDEQLENNLKNIFESYYANYNGYPSRRVFNKISPIDNSIYTHRFKSSWKDVCKYYGYEIEGKINKSENIALGIVKEILNEDYEPQKTFDWLIGYKNFPLFCDGYFPKYKLIVEFDGDQHRYPIEWFGGWNTFNDIRINDKYKDVLIPRNGLKIFRISSEEPFWNKEYITNKLIKSGIISGVNLITN